MGNDQRSLALPPPLKWAGGKRWLVPILAELRLGHESRRLVEPLCGGISVALGLNPQHARLNDVNAHAINFYRWAAKGMRVRIRMENDETVYYESRSRFNELVRRGESDSQEAAELFYFLNRTGYNGLCRFNRRGEFNVPFGRYTKINYLRDFSGYSRLSSWTFTSGDFEDTELSPGDFVYADPPYDVQFRQYSPDGFPWEHQERLATWLATHDGPVVLSNQNTPRIVSLYQTLGYRLMFLDAPRRISSSGDRTPAQEVLALRGFDDAAQQHRRNDHRSSS